MMVEGSESETKFRTIPSALGKNFSSRLVTTSIPDFIGRNKKNPIQPAMRVVIANIITPATKLDPNLDCSSSLCISAILRY